MRAALDRHGIADDTLVIVLFNEGAERIFGRSAREAIGQPLALLAFGSQLDDHFQPSMDTLFIDHIAKVLALVLPRYGQQGCLSRTARCCVTGPVVATIPTLSAI